MRYFKKYNLGLTFCFATLLGLSSAFGQLVSSNGETLVNTVTVDSTQQNCAVAMDTSGRYVVVWESEGEDGEGFGIYAKIYNADHSVRVADFQINTVSDGFVNDQRFPDVAMNAEGTFCVVWQSAQDEGWNSYYSDWYSYGWDCYRKIYDIDGGLVSSRSRVNSSMTGNQMHPAVAASDDRFVVTYMSEVSGQNESEIYGRVTQSNGAWVMSSTLIHSSTGSHMAHPDVAINPTTNDYTFTWQADSVDGDRNGIYYASYDNTYTQTVAPTQVNTTTTGNQQEPRIAMDENGEFMIVWSSFDQDGDHFGIYGQRYSAPGTTSGGEIAINSNTSGSQDHVAVAVSREGGKYIFSWTDDAADGNKTGIYGRTMLSNGSFLDVETLINTTTSDYQSFSDVAVGTDTTEAVYAWQSGTRFGNTSQTDPSYYGIYSHGFVVEDITPPVSDCQNITVYLDGTGNVSITAADLDDASYDNVGIVSMTASVTDFDCSDLGMNTSTLTVYDAVGLSDACVSAVIVEDTISPTAVCQDINVYLDGTGNAIWGANDIDNGSTDNCGSVALSADITSATCADVGANTVTLTVDDGNGNTSTCTSTVTVMDTVSPSAICQNLTVYLDGTGNATITGADVDGGSTDNCSIDSYALDVSSFTCADIGANTVQLTVLDPSGNSGVCSATVTVMDTVSPVASCQNITVYLDGTGNASIAALDVDNGSSDNCSIGSVSIDVASFTCANIGANTATLTVTDASGNTNTCTSTVTVLDTVSPTISCQDITIYLDGAGTASITSADVDNGSSDNCSLTLGIDQSVFDCSMTGANTVTLTGTDGTGNSNSCTSTVTVLDTISPTASCQDLVVYLDGAGNASITSGDVDNGSSDNCSVASLSIDVSSFDCSMTGANSVTLTVTDANGNTNTCSSTVTVLDTISPTASCQDITVYLDGSGTANIAAADIDNGSTDNCSTVTLGADITAFTCAETGANTVTLTVTDASGNISTCSSTVTILDTISPTVACQDITVYLDGTGNATITESDVDAGSNDNCSSPSLSIDINTFDCSSIGANTVTLTVTDGSGNTNSCTSTVTVMDTISPTASNLIAVTVECIADEPVDITLVSDELDNCTAAPTVTWVGDVSDGLTCPETITRSYNVADDNGNSINVTQIITVHDLTAPTASNPITLNVQCIGDVPSPNVGWVTDEADNCGVPTVTWTSDVSDGLSCPETISRTFTVSDICGNSVDVVQLIVVMDIDAPVADVPTLNEITGNCDITPSAPTATDNCDGAITGTPDVSFPITAIGTTLVTWTYTDVCGNVSTQTQDVTISAIDVSTWIASDGITIVASNVDAGVTYQWIDCNTSQAIPGETNHNYTPTYGSDFAVIVTQNDCSDTSDCVNSTVGIETIDYASGLDLIIYPNPASGGDFSVQLDGAWVGEVTIEMVDTRGRLIYKDLTTDKVLEVKLGELEPGTYFVRAMDEKENILTTRLVTVND